MDNEEIKESLQKQENEPLKEEQPRKKRKNIFKMGFIWRPKPSILSTTLCFTISGIICIILGIVLLIFSNKIKQFEIRYDNINECRQALNDSINKKCILEIELKDDFDEPVMVYYQLNNFHQNHRRYLKSKSISQLKGQIKSVDDIKTECEPIIRNSDLWATTSIDGTTLNPDDPANPCGLIARSYFNDTFTLTNEKEGNYFYEINSTNIAWGADRNGRYKKPKNANKIQWIDVEDERFMVWMRPSGVPNFRKLWGRINEKLYKGKYYLHITNNYQVESFNGKKTFVLSTINALGGDNKFLALSYIIVGGISIIIGIVFWIGYMKFHNMQKEKLN
jgi:hypothetical protein